MRAKQFAAVAIIVLFSVATADAIDGIGQVMPDVNLEQQHKVLMAARIKQIDSVCKLTDAQKRKLVVASKGAIDRAMAKWKLATKTARLQRGENRDGRVQVVRVGKFGGNQRPRGAIKQLGFRVLPTATIYAVSPTIATSQSIWTKTLAKVLTTEQKARLEKFQPVIILSPETMRIYRKFQDVRLHQFFQQEIRKIHDVPLVVPADRRLP